MSLEGYDAEFQTYTNYGAVLGMPMLQSLHEAIFKENTAAHEGLLSSAPAAKEINVITDGYGAASGARSSSLSAAEDAISSVSYDVRNIGSSERFKEAVTERKDYMYYGRGSDDVLFSGVSTAGCSYETGRLNGYEGLPEVNGTGSEIGIMTSRPARQSAAVVAAAVPTPKAGSGGAAAAGVRRSGSSRYEAQKRRDWNTFGQYLIRQYKPAVAMARCNGAHVLEFLRYLDHFGKTKVHVEGCVYFGQPRPATPPCACPLRQAWGSLDALIGRLRAAFEEHGGAPDSNPFASRPIRLYLREVRELQAKARGIAYQKKKRKRPMFDNQSKNMASPPLPPPPLPVPVQPPRLSAGNSLHVPHFIYPL